MGNMKLIEKYFGKRLLEFT